MSAVYWKYLSGSGMSMEKASSQAVDIEAASGWISRLALLFAVLATAASFAAATYIGWYRGGTVLERGASIAVLVILVIGAHLSLPWLARSPLKVRLTFGPFWILCSAVTFSNHVSFFLISQEHAGQRRMHEDYVSIAAPRPRSVRELSVILADLERVEVELVRLDGASCTGNCAWQRLPMVKLHARQRTLNQEVEDARRWQQEHEQEVQSDRRRSLILQQDQATSALAGWIGVSIATINLITAGVIALALEGMVCFAWYFYLLGAWPRSRSTTANVVTIELGQEPITAPDVTTVSVAESACDAISHDDSQSRDYAMTTSHDLLVAQIDQLRAEVTAGRFRPTVKAVRERLNCAQTTAREISRDLKSLMSVSREPVRM